MATEIGALRVALESNVVQFQRDMGKASNAATSFARKSNTQLGKVRQNFDKTRASVAKMRAGVLVAAAALTALGAGFKKALDEADAIGKTATRIGTTAEELQKLARAGELADVSMEQLEKGLTGLQRRLGEAEQGIGTAIRGLDDLGLTLDDLRGNPIDEQFRTIATAIAATEDPLKRAAAGNALLGRQWVDLLPLMLQGGDAIKETGERMDVLSNEAVAVAQRLNDAISEQLGNVWLRVLDRLILGLGRVAHLLGLIEFPEFEIAQQIRDQMDVVDELQRAIDAGQPLRNARGLVTTPVGELDALLAAAKVRLEELVAERDALIAPAQSPSLITDIDELLAGLTETLTPMQKLTQQLHEETRRAALEVEILRNGYDEAQAALVRMAHAAGVTTSEFAQLAPEAQRFLDVQRELLALTEQQAAAAERAAEAERLIAEAGQQIADQSNNDFDPLVDSLNEGELVAERLTDTLVRGFGDAARQAKSFDEALEGVGLRMLNNLRLLLEEIAARQILDALQDSNVFGGGGFFDELFTVAGAVLGGAAGGGGGGGRAAQGAVFDAGTRLRRFAQGGVVQRPTTFGTMDGPGLMGEAGPEAIMPLTRTAGGNLAVEAIVPPARDGGGDTFIINNNIEVQTGVQQTVRAEIANLMPQITQATKAGVVDAKQRNRLRGFR